MQTTIGDNGRLVIPAKIRQALQLRSGDAVVLSVVENELRIVSLREAARRSQAIIRKHGAEGVSLSKELLAERRREVARERHRR